MRRVIKHRLLSMILAVVLIANIGLMTMPKPAYAQWATLSPDIIGYEAGVDIKEEVLKAIKQALVAALTTQLLNLVAYMANNFAYESALWVVTGGSAGNPLYNSLPTREYMQNVATDTVATIYEGLVSTNIQGGVLPDFGVYVSDDPKVLQAMRLGLRSTVQPSVPESDYAEVTKNFEGYLATITLDESKTTEEKTAQILSIVSEGFDPRVSEIGAGAQVLFETQIQAADAAQVEAADNTQDDGFLALTHPVTGQRLTPSSFVQQDLYNSIFNAKNTPQRLSETLLGNSEGLIGIGVGAASLFTNTLLSTLIDRWQGGIFEGSVNDPLFSSDYDPFDADSSTSTDSSRVSELWSTRTFTPLTVSDFSLLSELSTCPAVFRGSSPGLFNCAIDTSFASAVARADAGKPLTLAEAIEEGYINGNWPLIPSSDTARNQDTKCYTYGFCHSNLVKMRRARLISVGWELAAESGANSDTDPVTLQEVIDGFYQCNSDGELDDEHPWCHLIDPDWVVKFPDTQCRTLAYGQLLQASGTDTRQEECVDIQSCINEDAFGNCTGGYGYCVREQNTWRFRGESCPVEYASCLSFTDTDGVEMDYLTNTLDYGDCNESNMGCLWYATTKELNEEDEYDWPEIPSVEAQDEDENVYQERIYFNTNVESCDEEDGGCSQVIEREDSMSLNMITNGSFEADDDSDGWPDACILDGATYDGENDVARDGDAAISGGSSGVFYKYGTVVLGKRFYTFSFYAAQPDSTSANGINGYLWLTDENGTQVQLSGTSYQGDCDIYDLDSDGTTYETIMIDSATAVPDSSSYERFECTFSTPVLSDKTLDLYAIVSFYGGDVWVDDVQLEQDEDASSYHAGYNTTSLTYDYVKLPPSYLGCTGAASDPDECDNYAGVCTEQEAGCTLYIPSNGDPSVTAVVGEMDQCPSVCSGYDTYRQEETLYEPDGDFPVYFIPSTAETCSQEAVGCDEFTNLETEEREYYTYLRACVTEDQAEESGTGDAAATFYTWEGSDEAGYQLRTWRLLESDLDSYTAGITYAGSSDTDNVPGSAPCSNWQMETTGGETIECIDDADGDGNLDADTADCDEHSDIIENPDCREFYDVDGEIHYRQWTETVSVTDSCVAYRKSDTVGDDASEQEDNCQGSGGFWDGDNGTCRYFGYTDESTSCAESESGCRAYTGGRSGNSRTAFKDLFENDTVANWETASASTAELSNESVATDGHSMRVDGVDAWTYLYEESGGCSTDGGCDSSTASLGGSCTVENGETYCGTLHNQLFVGKTYTLSFWAKGETDISVGFDIGFDSSSIALDAEFGSVELEAGWQYFSVGPLDMNENDYEDFGNGTALVFSPDSSGSFYIDNVTLREGEDDITVIKESWVTPAICDQNLDGEPSAQFHLGCQEYTDQESNTAYLKSFSNLCDEDKVGCDAYYVTNQSEDTGVAIYNATCYNTDSSGSGLAWTQGDRADKRTSCYLFTSSDGQSFDTDSPALCTIIAGKDSCQFDFEDWFIPEYLLDSESELFHIDYGPDATVVEADRDTYIIVDSSVQCSSSNAGCQELGQPAFTPDLSAVESWESVYLLNDPDSYGDILCSDDELFCAEYDAGSEGTWYFKNPGSHLCEYRTDVTVGGAMYDGWFREDTSEFCYGRGACSVLDDDGAEISCSSDADCYDTDTDTSYGECEIDTGSYVIGGTDSGIWRNGDTAYDGWVGTCQAQYSGCTEFQDRLDFDDDEFYGVTDGRSYYFIDNTSLDESNLLSSQRCSGQLSSKFGCALFNDAGDTGLNYNASASYISSARSSALHGDRTFALVDPIDCTSSSTSTIITPTGDGVDLCAQRCVWSNADLDSDFDPSTDANDVHDLYTYGGSCYDDSDCARYESDLGDVISGSCESSLADPDGTLTTEPVERLENDSNRVLKVTRDRTCSEWLTCASSYTIWDEADGKYRTICDGIDLCTEYSGDSSSSLCSQWDPDDPAVVFDVDRYVSRDVSWYGEEYAGYSVPNIFPIQHLSQVDIAPPAGFCDMSSFSTTSSSYINFHGIECEDSTDCGGDYCVTEDEDDYQIGYSAGACDENYAEDCTIGYCEASGSACSDDDDCEDTDDSCITGVCYEVSTTTCEDSTDCSSTQECRAGTCVEETGNCDLDYSCADAASTCFSSSAAKTGTCYSGTCFVAVNGNQFDDEITEGTVCRAQPEANSPFTQDVVTQWKYLDFINAESSGDASEVELAVADPGEIDLETISGGDDAGTIGTDSRQGGALPSTVKSGFDGAQTCAPGEVCECAYYKVSASTGSGYIGYDTDYEDIPITGVCSADSPVAGALCGDDDDCRYYNDTGSVYTSSINDGYVGTCQPFSSEQAFVGLEGYCLERDTGLNINGDPDLGACLTWFPVDQISGATDLYAKYKQAGYFQDTYVCSETTPTVTLRPSTANRSSDIACAATSGPVSKSNSYTEMIDVCTQQARCPKGFFAVIGQPAADADAFGGASTFAGRCSNGDNDCPYICVPEGAVHEEDSEELCLPPDEDTIVGTSLDSAGVSCTRVVEEFSYDEGTGGDDSVRLFTWACDAGTLGSDSEEEAALAAFNYVVNAYDDCSVSGIPLETVADALQWWAEHPSRDSEGGNCIGGVPDNGGWGCLELNYDIVPACTELLQVASGDTEGANATAPWTDRLYMNGQISTSPGYLAYESETAPWPFGASAVSPSASEDRGIPPRVAACYLETQTIGAESVNESSWTDGWLGYFGSFANSILPPTGGIDMCSDGYIPYDPLNDGAHDPDDPEVRTYIDFTWDGDCVGDGCTDLSGKWSVTGGKQTLLNRITQVFARLDGLDDAIAQWSDDFYRRSNSDRSVSFAFDTFSWEDAENDAGESYVEAYEGDVRAEYGQSPTVWAVDTDNCGPKYCEEGEENAVTLNNTNEGDVETSGGYYRASLKFFAAADKNQLPIRRVIVEWGDNSSSGSPEDDNYYKNHRGLQDEDDGVETQTQSKCLLEDEWGKTAASCDPNYFNYSHTYRCWDPTELPACQETDDGNLLNSPCTFDFDSCVFQPRVHVRDNWGWCTGTCSGEGCFDESSLDSPDLSGSCYYPAHPSSSTDSIDPWVYYDGYIYVQP